MTTTATVIKLGRLDAAVKWIGTGASAVTCALATALLRSDETLGTPQVNIHAMYWSTTATNVITITRNSVVLYYLSGSGELRLEGFDDATQNTSDIVVDLGAGGGTLILDVRKIQGYPATYNDQTSRV
jgi:hypothetical protein